MKRYQAMNNLVREQAMGKVNQENDLNIANIITGCRMLFSIGLLLCPIFSVPFYTMYLAAGFSDMIDGTVARKTNTVTEFGSRLDTMADFVFVVVCLIKFLPVIDIQMWLSVWNSQRFLYALLQLSPQFRRATILEQHWQIERG